jgi:hypothetical protein
MSFFCKIVRCAVAAVAVAMSLAVTADLASAQQPARPRVQAARPRVTRPVRPARKPTPVRRKEGVRKSNTDATEPSVVTGAY